MSNKNYWHDPANQELHVQPGRLMSDADSADYANRLKASQADLKYFECACGYRTEYSEFVDNEIICRGCATAYRVGPEKNRTPAAPSKPKPVAKLTGFDCTCGAHTGITVVAGQGWGGVEFDCAGCGQTWRMTRE